ncbi:MAG: hypothetical protein IPH09_13015 [bacterium]|nr:hypothetical protein [bacterium]
MVEITGNVDDRVAKWRRKIDRAIAKRKPHAEMWKKTEEYISLQRVANHNPATDGDLCAVNKTRAFINNRVASFVYKNPRFIVRPVNQNGMEPLDVNGKTVPRHQVAEHILNFIVQQPSFGADRASRRMAKAGLTSIGVVKVGYKPDYGKGTHTKESYIYDEQGRTWLRDPMLPQDVDSRGVPQNLIPAPDGAGKPYPIRPTSEKWFTDWVPPERMLYDPDGENEFFDHEWVACEYYWPISDIKANKRFNKTVREQVKGTAKAQLIDEGKIVAAARGVGQDAVIEEDEEYGRVFEIYDIRDKEVLWYADGCSDFLAIEEYPLGVAHSPYVHFIPDEGHADWYPHPVVTDLIPINQEIDKLRLLDLHGAYGNTPKWGFLRGDIEDEQLEALMSPIPNEAVRFEKFSHADPKKSLFAIDRQYTPPDFYARMQQLERDFDEVAGQSSEARGRASSQLATGINAIQQSNALREDDYRAQFSAAWREVGKKLLDSVQANMDIPTAVAIDGPDGEMFIGTITPDMIEGDYDVSVDVEDLMPRSTDLEMSNLIQMANLFGQYPLMGSDERISGPLLDKAKINSASLREGLVAMAQIYRQLQMGPPPNQPDAQGGAQPAQDPAMMMQQMGGANAGL